MAPFSKPETVLKQAEGLVSVGQTHAALQSLTEMFSSKRFRSTPLSSLEPIMLRFIELCIDLRKGRTAKEGLMQYKNIAQNTSVGSIEVVVNRFITLSDAKVREAQEKAAASGVEVDDLEASETPESILLGAVSGDQSKDRTDRALVTPWLKFLWEAYRTCLETLKNNARLEGIYQSVAQGAFKFCLTYGRKLEFKRLCETLRLHLANVAKYSHQPHSINLSDPDTLQHHLDTRFAQLNASVELELWQEAFRSVEDVHNLLTLAKRPPKPGVMANYYEKLTKIFLMSGNALFHAAAWGRYYSVVSSLGGKTDEEMARLAGQVMVSALAVPVGLPETENTRLTALLGLARTPTRAGLIQDALARNILGPSPPEVKDLYSFLEVTFDPLGLCKNIAPLFKSLNESPSYSPYLPLLHRALLSRLLSHLSQVYSSISLTNLFELTAPLKELPIPGAAEFYDEIGVQSYVIRCARQNEIGVKVSLDHKEGAINFLDPGFSIPEDDEVDSANDGIQSSTGDLIQKRLSNLAEVLHNSLAYLTLVTSQVSAIPKDVSKSKEQLRKEANKEREDLSVAILLSARRRELLSELHQRSERAAQTAFTQNKLKIAQEKEKQEKEEAKRREIERKMKEREEIRELEKRKYAKSLVESGVVKGSMEQLVTMDTNDILKMQLESLEKEKSGHIAKLKSIAKKIDHTERAFRTQELALLQSDYQNQQKEDQRIWQTTQQEAHQAAQRKHQEDLEAKKRLGRLGAEAERFQAQILEKRKAAYQKKLEVAKRKIEEEKSKRLAAHNAKLAEEKRREEAEQARVREEQERQRREEEERQRREEEERLAAEAERAEAERKKKEEEEKLAAVRREKEAEREKLAEQARIQAQREAEAEAKAEERRKARAADKEKERFGHRPSGSISGRNLNGGGAAGESPSVWRRATGTATSTPANSVPPTPTRSSLNPPPRSESPAPAAAGPAKYKPGAFGGAGGGWRAREEARKSGIASGTATPVRSSSPVPAAAPPAPKEKEEVKAEDDGFTTVTKKEAVWRPRRGRA